MYSLLSTLLVGTLAVPVTSAPQQEVAVPSAEDPVALDAARQLAELTEPHDLLFRSNLAGWRAGIERAMALDAATVKLEAAYPGISKAAIDAAEPLAKVDCEAFVVRQTQLKVHLYAQRMSRGELAEAIVFWRSAAAQRFLRAMIANLDPTTIVDHIAAQAVKTGTVTITPDDVGQIERVAARKTGEQISVGDQVAIMRFGQTETGRKYATARADAEKQLLEMVNRPEAAHRAEQIDVIQKAMLAFIDHNKAARPSRPQ